MIAARLTATAVALTLAAILCLVALPAGDAQTQGPLTLQTILPMVAADGVPPPPPPPPPPSGPVLYLTFDDGPHPVWTDQVLDVLGRHEASATFFMVGKNVERYPDPAKRTVSGGHGVGIHSYSHPYLDTLSRDGIRSELLLGQNAIRDVTGRTTTCMRSPYGSTSATIQEVAASEGLSVWRWNVDPRDWSRPGVTAIVSNVKQNAYPGAIVLFHDGGGDRSQTVAALDLLLADFGARGYRFASLPC